MATISIKLKVIADKETKNKLSEAHNIFNENVKTFEEFLLLAQCKDYYYDGNDGKEHYRSIDESEQMLDELLSNYPDADKDVCKNALGKLRDIIESKGSQAAGMLAKLYKEDSTAGTNNIAKIVSPEPEWIQYYDTSCKCFDSIEHKELADNWISSEAGQRAIEPALSGSGRPSAFKQAYKSGKEWYEPFIRDQKKYKKDLEDGLTKLLCDLENKKLLPIIQLPSQLVKEQPVWVKLYLKTALENYASYIKCDDETRNDYKNTLKAFDGYNDTMTKGHMEALKMVETFLEENYAESEHSLYLTSRMCRGLEKIRFEWEKCGTEEERIEVLNKWQSDKSKQKQIGDVNFLRWIAEEEQYGIFDEKCICVLLEYYSLLRDKEMKRRCASYTTADPLYSKRYLFAEAPKGSNYKKYKLSNENGILNMELPVLLKDRTGNYSEKTLKFKLAKNKQFSPPYDSIAGKRKDIEFIEGKNDVHVLFSNRKRSLPLGCDTPIEETFQGKLGGVDLRVEHNGNGRMTDAYISFTFTVDELCTDEFKLLSSDAGYNFGTAYTGELTKYVDQLSGKTLRALSIDLGLKQLGTCAIGKCNYDKSKLLQDYEITRQFMLRLPGEKCSADVDVKRQEASRHIWQLRSGVNYLSMLKRIYNQEDMEKRIKLLKQNLSYTKDSDKIAFFEKCQSVESKEHMNQFLSEEYDRYLSVMNAEMKDFRSGDITRKQERIYRPGKSFWSIRYLEDLRKLIIAWNALGYHIQDENKQMGISYGVSATRLLNHINNIKDDRIKTGADLIVQAARGYVYDEQRKCWIQKYEPCNVIVFEDLSRYRFRNDRPKRENSKLMQWSHREIINETERQAALYGICVYASTDAAYSSKYYHKTGTPGIRCDRLGKNDFNGDVLTDYCFERLPNVLQEKAAKLRIGDIVPSEIGSLFFTQSASGEMIIVNADMNAACNLQERFWHQHTHLLRLKTVNKNGELLIGSEDDAVIGKRVKGKYEYHYGTQKLILQPAEHYGHFRVQENVKGMKPPAIGDEKEFTLFNDPSGVFFDKEDWVGYKEYWDRVNKILIQLLATKVC